METMAVATTRIMDMAMPMGKVIKSKMPMVATAVATVPIAA